MSEIKNDLLKNNTEVSTNFTEGSDYVCDDNNNSIKISGTHEIHGGYDMNFSYDTNECNNMNNNFDRSGGNKIPGNPMKDGKDPVLSDLYSFGSGEPEMITLLRSRYLYFAVFSLVYGIFFTFCLYKNLNGITIPLFTAGTIAAGFLSVIKLNMKIKENTFFYTICAFLLGVSTCLTSNWTIIFFNGFGFILLFTFIMLHQFYDDRCWDVSRYFINFMVLLFSVIKVCYYPFSHLVDFLKNKSTKSKRFTDGYKNSIDNFKYVLIGVFIAVPLVTVILLLLSNADQVFYKLVMNLFEFEFISKETISIVMMIIAGFMGFYCFISSLCLKSLNITDSADRKRGNPIIAITFSSIVAVIYLFFSAIQSFYLFFGKSIGLPNGFTYSEYARRGFFELLFVAIINLILVILCLAFFQENKILKWLLIIISLCTYILIFSSVYRMVLYIRVYHLSFLRVLVLWFLGVLAILITGVIVSILKKRFHLFKFCIVTITLTYLIFSFSKPDRIIANYNLSHYENINSADLHYLLSNLSYDAAPVIFANINMFESYFENTLKNTADYDENIYSDQYIYLALTEYFKRLQLNYSDLSLRQYNYSVFKAVNLANDFMKEYH